MLPAGHELVSRLPEDARVLDVGGWAAPLNRADSIIDLMPYETRGALAPAGVGPGPPRFSAESWVIADICGSAPWPWAEDHFDFAVCTFTLEDVRDPIRVCEEMSRVARAGYVEVPTILDELTWMNPEASGGPWLGHSHHRWLCSLEDDTLVFLPKHHSIHARRGLRVPAGILTEEERVLAHHWQGRLPARERAAIDTYPLEELEALVRGRVSPSRHERTPSLAGRRIVPSLRRRLRGRLR